MSNIPVANTNAPLEPGQVRFYQACEPPLQAGGYRLVAQQQVKGIKSQPTDNQFGLSRPFIMSGPRFQLPPQDLQLVYPPANQVGNYEDSLPHVVLRTRSLPWIRNIDGSGTTDEDVGTPWLCLLTLYPEEIGQIKPQTITVKQLITPDIPDVLPPVLDSAQLTSDELNSQLLAIDLDVEVFRAISPALEELPFLAHVREVNTDQKELMDLVDDGWFSVVVGNRLPITGQENSCLLISVEGHQDHLYGGKAIPEQYKKIRLVSMASWRFTAKEARGSFLELMQDLPKKGGVDLLRGTYSGFNDNSPQESPNESLSPADQVVKEALEIGYIPLNHQFRTGEATTSWYRGPLSAAPTKPDGLGPYFFSDRAMRFDPETGVFNLSYAAAWQIGRLLALSDAAFARALFDWRIENHQQVHDQVATEHVQSLMNNWSLSSTGQTKTDLHDALFHVMGSVMDKVAPDTAVKEQPNTIQHHYRRDEYAGLLPGVMPDSHWQSSIQAGDDPLSILHRFIHTPPTVVTHGEHEDEQ